MIFFLNLIIATIKIVIYILKQSTLNVSCKVWKKYGKKCPKDETNGKFDAFYRDNDALME